MEPTGFEILFRCFVMPLMAMGIIMGGLFGFIAVLELMTGVQPGSKDSLLHSFFEEGAIFGPRKHN